LPYGANLLLKENKQTKTKGYTLEKNIEKETYRLLKRKEINICAHYPLASER